MLGPVLGWETPGHGAWAMLGMYTRCIIRSYTFKGCLKICIVGLIWPAGLRIEKSYDSFQRSLRILSEEAPPILGCIVPALGCALLIEFFVVHWYGATSLHSTSVFSVTIKSFNLWDPR